MAKTKQRFSVLLLSSVALVIGVALALALAPSTAKAATTTYTTASPDGSLSTYSNISQALSVAKQTGRPIAIDPGHGETIYGGGDPGARANGMKESDLTWKIANACKDYLESRGVTVYLTRGQYEYVSVAGRVERAVENNCCAIVSIHINAGGGRGAEVESTNSSSYNQDLYYAGQSLSALVLSGLQSTGLSIHGAGIITRDWDSSYYEDGSVADYYGITRYARKAGILGVIIEHGFIDGTSDSAKLSNSNYLTSFGKADGAAIYKQFYDSNTWWSVSGISVSTTEAYVGETVTYSPKIMGVGENLTYNYVWAKPDWSSWGSTVKDTGSMTSSASGTFTPTKPGTYWLFVDVCSNGTSKTTRMVTVNVKSGYGYRGVKVTTDMPVAGDAVNFSANVVGQTSGLTYNYVWSYEGSWKKGEWGSTVLSTGSDTSSTTGSFTPTKAGTYNLYVDVVDPDGTRTTKSTTVEVAKVANAAHAYNGVKVKTTAPARGYPVNFSADVSGDTSGLTYNYVWSYEGSWAKGEWGSTVLSTGSDTSETSGSFTPTKAGTYTLYVDVVSADGTRETKSTTVEVVETTPILGEPQVKKSQLVSDLKAGLKVRNAVFPSDVYYAYGASTVEEFIDRLWEAAVAEGVRPEVIYAQAMVETGYLQFGGDVKIGQCNFCGLGATGQGNPGADFSSYGSDAIRIGFLAQAQHLRAYAGKAPLSSKTYDPRYGTWLFGRSYTVEGLSGTWASNASYANSIKAILNRL